MIIIIALLKLIGFIFILAGNIGVIVGPLVAIIVVIATIIVALIVVLICKRHRSSSKAGKYLNIVLLQQCQYILFIYYDVMMMYCTQMISLSACCRHSTTEYPMPHTTQRQQVSYMLDRQTRKETSTIPCIIRFNSPTQGSLVQQQIMIAALMVDTRLMKTMILNVALGCTPLLTIDHRTEYGH